MRPKERPMPWKRAEADAPSAIWEPITSDRWRSGPARAIAALANAVAGGGIQAPFGETGISLQGRVGRGARRHFRCAVRAQGKGGKRRYLGAARDRKRRHWSFRWLSASVGTA